MPVILANRAQSRLAAAISSTTTVVILETGTEGRFPTPLPDQWFPLTVVDASGNAENMRVTARDGVTLTVERGQEGTTARTFPAHAKADLRLTIGALASLHANAATITEGQLPVAVMPAHLQATLTLVASADLQTVSGVFRTSDTTTGLPTAAVGVLQHAQIDADTAYQLWRPTTLLTWQRVKVDGIWEEWEGTGIYLPIAGGAMTGQLTLPAAAADLVPFRIVHGTDPTTPPDGAIWTTFDGIRARIAGVTRQMAYISANAFTGKQTFVEGSADGASMNVPHGAAPDVPVDGDVWSTAAGIFARINGATRQLATLADNGFTSTQTFAASTALQASIRLPPGVAPDAPLNGDVWTTAVGMFVRISGITRQLATLDGLETVAWQAGASTTKATPSPADIKAAIDAHVYAGTSQANLDFPIGSTVVAYKTGAPTARGGVDVIRLAAGNLHEFTVDGAGDVLAGTWRSRGALGTTAAEDLYALYQRTA